MNKSKKILLAVALVFLVLVLLVVYDMSQRTTFPWQKSEQKKDSSVLQVKEN